jgi:hypothetical protein
LQRVELSLEVFNLQIFSANIGDIHIVDQTLDLQDHAVEPALQFSDLVVRFRDFDRYELLVFYFFHMPEDVDEPHIHRACDPENNRRGVKQVDQSHPDDELPGFVHFTEDLVLRDDADQFPIIQILVSGIGGN